MTEAEIGRIADMLEERLVRRLTPRLATAVEARLGLRLERIEGRLHTVEGRLGRVESRLGRVEGRLGKVEERIGKVEGHIVSLAGGQTRLSRLVSELQDRIIADEEEGRS